MRPGPRLAFLWWVLAPMTVGAEVASFQEQEEPLLAVYGDEDLVSLATGSRQPVHRAASVSTVITAEEIRRSGARNLDQILEQVPGFHVSRSAISRQDAVYSVRGIHTGFNPQVLVLMDGVGFPHLYSGGRPSSFTLPVEQIERIEVIRGPGSAVHGADAFAGVVNIITKSPAAAESGQFGMRAGSFDTSEAWFQRGGKVAGLDSMFTMSWLKTNGDTGRVVDRDLQSMLDAAAGTRLSQAPGPLETRANVVNSHLALAKDRWTFRGWSWLQNEAGMGPGGAQALDPVGHQDAALWLGDLTYDHPGVADDLDATFRLNYYYAKDDSYFRLFPTGMTGNPVSLDHQVTGEGLALYTGLAHHKVRGSVGFKYSYEDTEEYKNFGPGVVAGHMTDVSHTPFVNLKPHSREVIFATLQDAWALAQDWELTVGMRLDHYADFGDTLNPRAALVWATRHDLTTRLMAGRAFRAPSFSELYVINNPAVLGNPDLQPEIIHTYELAFDYRPSLSWRTGFNLFYYQIDGLVEFVPDANGTTSTARNSRDQTGRGFELESAWRVSEALRLTGNLSWNRAVDDRHGERVADAPGRRLFLAGQWQFAPDWTLNPRLIRVMDRARAAGDNRPAVPDYTVVNLALRRERLADNWEVAILAQNLFDADAREPAGRFIPHDYPLEGLGVFAELRYHFTR